MATQSGDSRTRDHSGARGMEGHTGANESKGPELVEMMELGFWAEPVEMKELRGWAEPVENMELGS